MQSRKEVRAFRLDTRILQMISMSAKLHGVSENALVEGILARNLRFEPVARTFDYISVGKETFALILGMSNSAGLELVGAERGKPAYSLARELFESNGIELSLQQYTSEILGEGARWFRPEGTLVRPERMTLQHGYGPKWSEFLSAYLSSAFEVVSHGKLDMVSAADYVAFRFPESDSEFSF